MTRITVAVRTRPTASFAKDIIQIQPDNKGVVVELPKQHADEVVNNQNSSFSWSFDAILHNAPQETVYSRIAAPAVADALRGINATVLMYGQTGSGKTYTAIGDMGTFKYRGLVPRALADIFAYADHHPENEVSVAVSHLEIYNDQLTDLLAALPASALPAAPPQGSLSPVRGGGVAGGGAGASGGIGFGGDLQICESSKTGEVSVKGQRIVPVASEEAALALLFEGESNRAVARHELNKTSTRGHSVFTIHLAVRSRVESSGKVLSAKLNLVDLAGSERLKKTGTSGERMAESMSINRSLSYLEQLVVALASKNRSHLPYRQSKLTHLLKDAIGGNCRTSLIACIHGEAQHIEETVSTLQFASRAMRVTNAVNVNAVQDQSQLLRRYEGEIRQLRQELAMHDSLAGRSRVAYDPYTEAQQAELRERLRAHLEGTSTAAGPLQPDSVRMMAELLEQMKVLWAGLKHELQQRPQPVDASAANGGVGSLDAAFAAAGGGAGATGAFSQPAAGDESAVGELDLRKSAGIAVGLAPDNAAPAGGFEMPTRRSPGGATARSPGASFAGSAGYGGGFGSPGDGFGGDASGGYGETGAGFHGNASRISAMSASGGMGMDRNEAFAFYKTQGGGAEAAAELIAAKEAQQRTRLAMRASAERVNGLKVQIARADGLLAAKRAERARIEARVALASTGSAARNGTGHGGDGDGEELIIDEEEYALLKSLKGLKADYRAAHDAHAQCAAEHKDAAQHADSLRASLLADFNDWFESGGGQTLDVFERPPEKRAPGADVMDDNEAFDHLQEERVRDTEPDSLAFFNASKAMKKRGKTLRPV